MRTGRHYVGYDTDPAYVGAARARVDAEGASVPAQEEQAAKYGAQLLHDAGFADVTANRKPKRGAPLPVDLVATDRAGREWWFLVAGSFTSGPTGLRRADVLWRTLGRAAALHAFAPDASIAVLTTGLPTKGTPNETALRAVVPSPIHAVIDLSDPASTAALRRLP